MLTLSLSVNVDDDIDGVDLAAMSNINKAMISGVLIAEFTPNSIFIIHSTANKVI